MFFLRSLSRLRLSKLSEHCNLKTELLFSGNNMEAATVYDQCLGGVGQGHKIERFEGQVSDLLPVRSENQTSIPLSHWAYTWYILSAVCHELSCHIYIDYWVTLKLECKYRLSWVGSRWICPLASAAQRSKRRGSVAAYMCQTPIKTERNIKQVSPTNHIYTLLIWDSTHILSCVSAKHSLTTSFVCFPAVSTHTIK